MSELPIAPIVRICKKANPSMNISWKAKQIIAETLEDECTAISEEAVRKAKENGRKTVLDRDVDGCISSAKKIVLIKEVFRQFHDRKEWERELDTIDVCMAVEDIISR